MLEAQERITERTIGDSECRVWFDEDNRLRIFWGETEITKYHGLSTRVLSEAQWHHFCDGRLGIRKISPVEMEIVSQAAKSSFTQRWKMNITPDKNIRWEMYVNTSVPLRLDEVHVQFYVSRFYDSWSDSRRRGCFPSFSDTYVSPVELSRDTSDQFGALSSQEEYPTLLFHSFYPHPAVSHLYTSDLTLSCRIFEFRFCRKDESFLPGEYLCGTGEFQIDPSRSLLEKHISDRERQEQQRILREKKEEEQRCTLSRGAYRLYLDPANQIYMYHGEHEITKGDGFRVVCLTGGRWYSSRDSTVTVERPSAKEMIIYFRLHHLPLVQKWYLTFSQEDALIWNVDIECRQPLLIDYVKASLFVSKGYREWVAGPDSGSFPARFDTHWVPMNQPGDAPPAFIGVLPQKENIPGFTFQNEHTKFSSLSVYHGDIDSSACILEASGEETMGSPQAGTIVTLRGIIRFYPRRERLQAVVARLRQRREKERKRRQEEFQRLSDKRACAERIEELAARLKKENVFVETRPDDKNKKNAIYLYGDNAVLHDKAGDQSEEFLRIQERIKNISPGDTNLRIGVTKFNFFRLAEIVQYASTLMNQRIDLRSLSLSLFPVRNLLAYFIEYLRELNTRIQHTGIELFLKDHDLLELLSLVSTSADQHNEKDLLRLLGVICEHAFIGPQTIVLDTFHSCNTDCIHCWIHNPKRVSSRQDEELKMDDNLYRRIIDDAAELLCDEIIIQGDGEPLLDTRFIDMVRYARNKGLKVLFFTNGILLDEKKAKILLELEINEIFCSLPAGTAQTYALINSKQSKDIFGVITKNLSNLISLRNALGKRMPLVQMTHVIHALNYHELEEMARTDVAVGADKIRFYLARIDQNIKNLKLQSQHIEQMRDSIKKVSCYLNEQERKIEDNLSFQLKHYDSRTGYWSENAFLKLGCPVGWFFCLVLAKGEVSMCCHLRVIDSINGRSLEEIWNSPEYNQLRIQAKDLTHNKNVVLKNGVRLYDEFCNNCDTHQVILRIHENMKEYGLEKFMRT